MWMVITNFCILLQDFYEGGIFWWQVITTNVSKKQVNIIQQK